MKKDFNRWTNIKTIINNSGKIPFFHERDIWFSFLGMNVGFEQDGRGIEFQRPILIIKKFNNSIYWAIPLSRTKNRGRYHFPFDFGDGTESVALLSQIRLLDARRLVRRIGYINKKDFQKLIEKLRELLP